MLGRRISVCAAAGAALAVARCYALTDRFKDLGRQTEVVERDFSVQWDTSIGLTPGRSIFAIGTLGALFGAAFPLASQATRRQGTVAGAVYGIAAYGASELIFRAAPARTRSLAADPEQMVHRFALYGAAIGWIDAVARD